MIEKNKVLEKDEISKIQELKDRLKKITEVSGVVEIQNYNIQIKKEQAKRLIERNANDHSKTNHMKHSEAI